MKKTKKIPTIQNVSKKYLRTQIKSAGSNPEEEVSIASLYPCAEGYSRQKHQQNVINGMDEVLFLQDMLIGAEITSEAAEIYKKLDVSMAKLRTAIIDNRSDESTWELVRRKQAAQATVIK